MSDKKQEQAHIGSDRRSTHGRVGEQARLVVGSKSVESIESHVDRVASKSKAVGGKSKAVGGKANINDNDNNDNNDDMQSATTNDDNDGGNRVGNWDGLNPRRLWPTSARTAKSRQPPPVVHPLAGAK